MSSVIVSEFQAVIDKLNQEGHILAVRLKNALNALEEHFHKAESEVVAAVEPQVESAKAEVAQLATEIKAEATAATADVTEAVQGK